MPDIKPPIMRPRYLSFLPGFLFRPERPLAYIAKAFPLTLLPSLLLSAIVTYSASAAGAGAEAPAISVDGPEMVFLLTLFAPFVETLIMILPLLAFNRLFGPGPAVVLSAIGWGAVHSLGAWIWGLVVWWPFLIFSIVLLTWRQRGLLLAVLMVTVLHALQNSFAAGMLLLAAASGQAS